MYYWHTGMAQGKRTTKAWQGDMVNQQNSEQNIACVSLSRKYIQLHKVKYKADKATPYCPVVVVQNKRAKKLLLQKRRRNSFYPVVLA